MLISITYVTLLKLCCKRNRRGGGGEERLERDKLCLSETEPQAWKVALVGSSEISDASKQVFAFETLYRPSALIS